MAPLVVGFVVVVLLIIALLSAYTVRTREAAILELSLIHI